MGKGKRNQIESNRIEWKREIELKRKEKAKSNRIESNHYDTVSDKTHTRTNKQTRK